jgi:ketosteroid isomerase-like protein
MSSDENIAIVRRYCEDCANDYGDPEKRRAMDAADALLTSDFAILYNGQGDDEATRGLDRHKAFLLAHTQAFRGEHWTPETVLADGETVASLCRVRATHSETSSPIDLWMADFFTLRDGRLAGLRRFLDFQALEAQIEAQPAAM